MHRHTNKTGRFAISGARVSREITADFYFLLCASNISSPPVSSSGCSNLRTHTQFVREKEI